MAGYGFGANPYQNGSFGYLAPTAGTIATGNAGITSFLEQIATAAKQYSDQMYQWGQQTFANTSNITDANIDRYLAASSQALGLATNEIQRYQDRFQPQEDALIADANSYASPERMALEMGQAESTTAQAMNAGRNNAIRDLQSYGIDPSAGRYAGLDVAQRAMAAAAEAGAGQQARQATEATGRQLRQQAIQVGMQYPGQAVNALNLALSGVSGAQNAALANANTGIALNQLPKSYLDTAMGLRYPPNPPTPSPSGVIPSPTVPHTASPSPGTIASAPSGTYWNPTSPTSPTAPVQNPWQTYNYPSEPTPPGTSPWDETGMTGWEQPQQQQFDPTNAMADPYSYEPYGGGAYDPYGGGYEDYGGQGGYAYAKGGPVRTPGGPVPRSASPSQGLQTDDIPASLNADEFVVPQDVAKWKGQEFFQKLIEKSRMDRVKAPAHGKPGPQAPGPIRFASQAVG